jgi:hypothetical protein
MQETSRCNDGHTYSVYIFQYFPYDVARLEFKKKLLYRINNGGIGDLDPDVWWVLIGIDDLTDDFCNVDAIAAANIAVVEEIISLRPNATVAINSLLPRTPTFWMYLSQINERLKCYAAVTY